MTSTLRPAGFAAASALLLLALTSCAGGGTTTPTATETTSVAVLDSACADDAGVTIIVDSAALDGGDSTAWCIGTDEAIPAADALALVDVKTEGTKEYGDQVVCRVDGVPAEKTAIPAEDGSDYFETCASMPAAFAYWSLWQKPAGGEWGYAQEGLSTLELQPGDALELLFTLHGEPAAPAS